MTDDIEPQVVEFIRGIRPTNTGADASTDLIMTGMLDSLAILELVDFVAKRFSVTVPARDLLPANFRTARTVTALIRARSQ